MTNSPEPQRYPSTEYGQGGYSPSPTAVGDWSPSTASPPQRKRMVWIIAAAVALAVTAAIVLAVANPFADTDDAPTAPTAGSYHVQPQAVLPSVAEIRRTTMLAFKGDAAISYGAPAAPTTAQPASCGLLQSPGSAATWGAATSVATEFFRDDPKDFSATVWLGLAQFDSDTAAAASVKTITDAAQGCTTYTNQLPGADPALWKRTDLTTGEASLVYTVVQSEAKPTWACGNVYRVVRNIAATVTLCSQNPSDLPTWLVDLMIEKVKSAK